MLGFILLFNRTIFAESYSTSTLKNLLSSLPHKNALVGACVVDLVTGETIFEYNADTSMIPASTMKVFTMAAGLEHLGPDFSFTTSVYTDGVNLYIEGDGDPGFGDEKLCKLRDEAIDAVFYRWADALQHMGISTFPGKIVIDETIFDDQIIHQSWEKNDLGKWYAAPVGGLNINDNCVDITIRPDKKTNDPVLISIHPETTLARFINKCKSGGGRKKKPPVLHHPHDSLDFTISGRCSKKWPFSPVAFPDPGMLFANVLRIVLDKKGITFVQHPERRIRGEDRSNRESFIPVARHQTSINDVLKRTGKNSQNLFAECLMKRAGYAHAVANEEDRPQGNWLYGQRAVLDVMTQAGISTEGFAVSDGSGLSRENRCTARQLVSLLQWTQTQPWSNMFHDNLSIAGVDGSLKKRLADLPGRVYAKTGTMRGVRVLTGFIHQENAQPRFALAVMFNSYKGPSTPYRNIQDKFCRTLMRMSSDIALQDR